MDLERQEDLVSSLRSQVEELTSKLKGARLRIYDLELCAPPPATPPQPAFSPVEEAETPQLTSVVEVSETPTVRRGAGIPPKRTSKSVEPTAARVRPRRQDREENSASLSPSNASTALYDDGGEDATPVQHSKQPWLSLKSLSKSQQVQKFPDMAELVRFARLWEGMSKSSEPSRGSRSSRQNNVSASLNATNSKFAFKQARRNARPSANGEGSGIENFYEDALKGMNLNATTGGTRARRDGGGRISAEAWARLSKEEELIKMRRSRKR